MVPFGARYAYNAHSSTSNCAIYAILATDDPGGKIHAAVATGRKFADERTKLRSGRPVATDPRTVRRRVLREQGLNSVQSKTCSNRARSCRFTMQTYKIFRHPNFILSSSRP